MDEAMQTRLIKQIRRGIIRTLHMVYGSSFDFPSIASTLPNAEEDHLKRDLTYLIDKGYVVWSNEARNLGWERRTFRLTAKGVEIADRIVTDSALEP